MRGDLIRKVPPVPASDGDSSQQEDCCVAFSRPSSIAFGTVRSTSIDASRLADSSCVDDLMSIDVDRTGIKWMLGCRAKASTQSSCCEALFAVHCMEPPTDPHRGSAGGFRFVSEFRAALAAVLETVEPVRSAPALRF